MLIFFITLLCSGFVQFTKAEEIGRKPAFDFSSAPPRYVFLKDIHSKFHAARTSLKIVNGQAATRGQFCYQVYLQFTDGHSYWSCGGSLVTAHLIVTAAHCVQGSTSAVAVLGGLDLSKMYEPGRRIIKVSSSGLRFHEKYDSSKIYNDIGVVKLTEAVQLNEDICTVKLPSCSAPLIADSDNNNYTVSGWGKTSDRTRSSKLMYVIVAGEPQNSCTSFYRTVANYDVIESQICTSGAGGKSTCNVFVPSNGKDLRVAYSQQGDSGGPLVLTDSSGNITQHGIVSLGLNSCELSAPSVYTNVLYFMDWLCPQL